MSHFPAVFMCERKVKDKMITQLNSVSADTMSISSQTHYTVPDTERNLETLSATIECEQPQPDLYK